MVDWDKRSFAEMENSADSKEHSSIFGSPLTDDSQPRNTSSHTNTGESTVGQQQQTEVGSGRATYGGIAPGAISATAPDNQVERTSGTSVQPHQPGAWTPYGTGNTAASRTGDTTVDPLAAPKWAPSANQMPGAQTSTQPGVGDRPLTGGAPTAADQGPAVLGPPANLPDDFRPIVEKSLHQETGYTNYATWSVLGALAGSGPLPWALDKAGAYKKFPFMANYSPTSMQIEKQEELKGAFTGVQDEHGKNQTEAQSEAAKLQTSLDAGKPTLDAYIKSTEDGLKNASSDSDRSLYKNKLEVLQKAQANFSDLTPDEITKSGFTSEEAKFLAEQKALSLDHRGFTERATHYGNLITDAQSQVSEADRQIASLKDGNSRFPWTGGKPNIPGMSENSYVSGKQVQSNIDQHIYDNKQAAKNLPAGDVDGAKLHAEKEELLKRANKDSRVPLTEADILEANLAEKPSGLKLYSAQEIADLENHLKVMDGTEKVSNRWSSKIPGVTAKFPMYNDVQLPVNPPGSSAWKPDNTGIKKIGNFHGDSWSKTVGSGLAVGTAALVADNYIDKYAPKLFGQEGNDHNLNRDFYLKMPALAAAMIIPRNAMSKLGWSAAALAGNQLLNHTPFLSNGTSGEYSKIMRPNQVDAFSMGAAFMLPAKSIPARFAAVGVGWGAGRLANLAGWGNSDLALDLDHDLKDAIKNDKPTSHKTFEDIVHKGAKLGMENEKALTLAANDFNTEHRNDKNAIAAWHGDAAMKTAVADFNFERGTKTDPKASNAERRILVGKNLDLGGDSLELYRAAAGELINAQNKAIKDKLPQDQIDGLKESTKFVEDKINGIYGEHDIDAAFNELKQDFPDHIDKMSRFEANLGARVKGLNTTDPRYLGKMSRDMALLDMAIASYMAQHGNGGDAHTMFASAQDYLQVADKLDPKAPDLAKLKKIAKEVAKAVPDAETRQYDNSFNNPFGMEKPTH